jgi:hypothetical protein
MKITIYHKDYGAPKLTQNLLDLHQTMRQHKTRLEAEANENDDNRSEYKFFFFFHFGSFFGQNLSFLQTRIMITGQTFFIFFFHFGSFFFIFKFFCKQDR